MLYKDQFTLYAFGIIACAVLGLLLLFGIAYLINRRLDTLALRRRMNQDHSKLPERLFWRIAKWTIQGTIFISTGLFFLALSGFTPVPIIVLWLLFFVVWGLLFLHKFRSFSLPTNQFIQLQNIFDEEDDFAIDDMDINITSIPRKSHSIREKAQHYIYTCKLAIKNKKIQFIVGLVIILFVTSALIFSTNCMCVAIHPFSITTGLSRKLSKPFCEPGAVCNVYFTLGTNPGDFIVNFQASEFPEAPFVWYDEKSHGNEWVSFTGRSKISANAAKMTTIDELERHICWADLSLPPNTTRYVVTGYQRGLQFIVSKEFKIRSLPDYGYTFVSGGDMSMDATGHKMMEVAAATSPHFAMVGGDITYDNGFAACYRRWDEWFDFWDKLMVTPEGYSIPIIAAVGNHEAGGFMSAADNDPYFTSYFPQQTGIIGKSRSTYHSHRITKNLFIVVLDTDIVSRIDGIQAEWLESALKDGQEAVLKAALYHGNLYPGIDESSSIAPRGIQFWEPSFDKYNLTIAFENHCHAYKRTYPIRNNQKSDDGTVYLGDGAWGVPPRATINAWYLEKAASVVNVYKVQVDKNSVKADALGIDSVAFDTWQKNL